MLRAKILSLIAVTMLVLSTTCADAGSAAALAPILRVTLGELPTVAGHDAMWAVATATDRTGRPITLEEAAAPLGVDHFNWVQFLIADPDVGWCADLPTWSPVADDCVVYTTVNGRVPTLPTLDPPLGGWKYQGGRLPTADFWPYYWDEIFDPDGHPDRSDPERVFYRVELDRLPASAGDFERNEVEKASAAFGYVFNDDPTQQRPGRSVFVDVLAGVRRACGTLSTNAPCPGVLLPGTAFEWSSSRDDGIRSEHISLARFIQLSGSTPASLKALGLTLPP